MKKLRYTIAKRVLIFSALLCRHCAEIGENSEEKTENEREEKHA